MIHYFIIAGTLSAASDIEDMVNRGVLRRPPYTTLAAARAALSLYPPGHRPAYIWPGEYLDDNQRNPDPKITPLRDRRRGHHLAVSLSPDDPFGDHDAQNPQPQLRLVPRHPCR